MTGSEYRDLIASYIHRNFQSAGLVVYTEINLGKTIIGKARKVDVFVVQEATQRALSIECKYQDTKGTTDEKIPYALQDLTALRVPACLCYAGDGWSRGVLHTLAASSLAAYCLPDASDARRTDGTVELDHVLAATFSIWSEVLPASRRWRQELE
ncbi:MAG: hypothetical protein K1X67_16260 [Fimbriimonadaceae bacterium]|nr:hypothetical protein [Fimbriimonadaceae bacterium]